MRMLSDSKCLLWEKRKIDGERGWIKKNGYTQLKSSPFTLKCFEFFAAARFDIVLAFLFINTITQQI